MKKSDSVKLKILVCEAHNRILHRLSSWIKAMGNEVYSTNDGIVSLEIFEEQNPDIILLSQDLKSMGSLEVIRIIREKKSSQAIILMLETHTDTLFFKNAIDLQVDKYLNKPIDATQLFNAIEALSKEKIWHEEFNHQKRALEDYKDAIDSSFSVSIHDTTGRIFYVNEHFLKTTALSYEDALEGRINPLQNPNTDIHFVMETLQKEHIYRARQIFKFENKKDAIIDVTAVAILDKYNEISEYLVFSNDVSKIIYAARKIKNQEIAHKREINMVKDSFLTVFTHELKTPLNSIINFSQYVKKHLLKENFTKRDVLTHQLDLILFSGLDMLTMINNLMDAIELRDNKLSLTYTTFNFSELIDNLLYKYESSMSGAKIIKSYSANINITSDEMRLKQILDNILSNSIKYSHSTIDVTFKVVVDRFILEVSDDGDGFSNPDKLFELFEQSSENEMTRTAQGIGVGLYVVKKLCDNLKYDVILEKSEKLGGAQVTIHGNIGSIS